MRSGLRACWPAGSTGSLSRPAQALEAQAVIRYRHPGVAARITPLSPGEAQVIFAAPQSAVAPGQAVAFYLDDRVLGGGWIEARIR